MYIHVVSSLELGALHQSRGLVIEVKSAPNFVKPVWKSSEMNVSVMNRIVSKDELPTLTKQKIEYSELGRFLVEFF